MIKFILTGFPSPWRAFRRWSVRRRFNKMSLMEQYLVESFGVDPDTLIKRGLL
jgi:hypothetical protein